MTRNSKIKGKPLLPRHIDHNKIIIMKLLSLQSAAAAIAVVSLPSAVQSLASTRPLRVTVFGGTGYVGSAVCERLVRRGHDVTAVSRRGVNPKPDSKELSKVRAFVHPPAWHLLGEIHWLMGTPLSSLFL
jgi:hypothetical protein